MLWTNTAFELAVLIPILITGWQDYRTREASNLITIPYFFIGVGMGIYRYHEDHSMWYVFLIQGLITLITWFNGMGGADWKMQCGLFGLHPLMGLVSVLAEGIWGAVLLLRHGPQARFPKLSVMALSSALTFLIDISIMPSIVQFLPGRIVPTA